MKTFAIIFLVFALILPQAGCGTIVSGRTQDVMIRSNPPGATVAIDEIVMGTTPMIANLLRKQRHQIKVSKNGYAEVVRATTRGFNWWYIANIVFGGIIGLFIDPCTGAIFVVEPEDINVSLPKEGEVSLPSSGTNIAPPSAQVTPPISQSSASQANATAVPSVDTTTDQDSQVPAGSNAKAD